MRLLLLVLPICLPAALKRVYYRRVFGWTVGRRVRVGLSYLDAATADLADDVRIGHFNILRNLADLRIGAGTYFLNFNQVSGARSVNDPVRFASRLAIGSQVFFMSHHFVDVAGTVTIGDRTTVGGRDTHVWSHTLGVEPDGSGQIKAIDVTIGADCYLGARVTVVGCSIPVRTFVGAGSVVTKSFPADPDGHRVLLAGNPAAVRKRYPSPFVDHPSGRAPVE